MLGWRFKECSVINADLFNFFFCDDTPDIGWQAAQRIEGDGDIERWSAP